MTTTTAITIRQTGDSITLQSPYADALPPAARRIGGRWDPAARVWRFDARDEQRVRDLAIDIYGTDGTDDDTVTVTIDLSGRGRIDEPTITVAGRVVAERRWRDSDVRLADGVIITAGDFAPCGGSKRRPAIGEAPVTLEVRDIPRTAALREGLEIIEAQDADREALRAKRARLAARIAEIDATLGA